jgi:DNA ligase (NAD+)
VKTIKNIPKKLNSPVDLHVRGEIMMPKSVRKDINEQRESDGETPFANTRNAAAGSIKLLDSKEVEKRGLVCYVYDILSITEKKEEPSSANISRKTID